MFRVIASIIVITCIALVSYLSQFSADQNSGGTPSPLQDRRFKYLFQSSADQSSTMTSSPVQDERFNKF